MGRIMDGLVAFFKQDDWNFTEMPDRPFLKMGYSGDDANWTCYAQAREEQEQAVFYSYAPVKAPDNRRVEMAEFLTRANYGLIIGNFEMDLNDGEVRYKTSIDVEGAELSFPLMKSVVYANVMTMNRYMRGIMAVCFGGMSAADAITMVEGPPST